MTEEVKGLSYVPQIKAAHAELIASHESKLQCAVKLGGLLNDAKDSVGKDRQWMKFREAYFPEISHRTATNYMALAKDLADPANWQRVANLAAGGDLSIRTAIEAMRKANGGGQQRATRTRRAPAVVSPPVPASPDLKAQLQNVGIDEIKIALKEADRFEELAAEIADPLKDQLQALPLDDVVDVLVDALDEVLLYGLVKQLNAYLKSLNTPSVDLPADGSIPTFLQQTEART